MTDADDAKASKYPPLNDPQSRIVDAALNTNGGLFILSSVPGAGKTHASSRLCADFLLERAAADKDRPAAGLAVVAFNRDAAAKLQPKVADWLRQLVADGTTREARRVGDGADDVSQLIGAFRRSEAVSTIDALLARVFRDIAAEVGFDDPTVGTDHAVDRLHSDAFEMVCADPAFTDKIARLGDAYPSENNDTDEPDRVADLLETITKTARNHGWAPSEVKQRLHESRRAFYPDGPPSSLADVIEDARRFAGDGAGVSPTETWSEDKVVAADRALHDAWEARINDLVAVYRSYVAAYDRASRARGVVSHGDCAHWIRQYFDNPSCPHQWADDATSESIVDQRRTRLCERWQSRIDLLVIDEAQDLSIGQHDALAQLVTDETRVVLCGDPFQSIYTWRNARPSLFTSAIANGEYFGREWDTHVVETAQTTYRQRPALTDAVDSVFGPALDDPGRGDAHSLKGDYDPLSPDRDATDGPRLHFATYRPRYKNDDGLQAEVLAEYLRGALEEEVFDDSDGDPVTDDDSGASDDNDPTGTHDNHQPPIQVLFRSGSSMETVRRALTDVGLSVGEAVSVFDQPLARTIVSLLEWLVDPLATEATNAIRDAAVATNSDTLTAVADYVDDVGWVTVKDASDTTLDGHAVQLFTELRTLATDTAERARASPQALVERLCRVLAVDEDPFEIQPDSNTRRRRRIRDELRAAAADADGPETSPSEVIAALTAFCEDPDNGPSLPVNAANYDAVFETVHSFKGAESQVVALGDPAFNPTGSLYTDSLISRGSALALCPPATTNKSTAAHGQRVPVDGYGGGLFDHTFKRSSEKDSGLRWVTNRSRTDSQTTYAGPERFAKLAAEERAEQWRLGYVAATRPRNHLVVPALRQSDLDPSDSWAAAFANVFALGDVNVPAKVTRHPDAAEQPVCISVDDVAMRNPSESPSKSWTGRSPSNPHLAASGIGPRDWLPQFVDASSLYPLSKDHDRYVVDHLLGRQLNTDTGTTDTDAPLGTVAPGVLGQIAHDAFGSLIRSDPDCDRVQAGDVDLTPHVDRALTRARLNHGLDDTQRTQVRDYLIGSALPAFVASSAFERLCHADTVFVEEPLETRVRVDGLRVELRGRADFLAQNGDQWLIEDIKLTFATRADETDNRYRLQLATYRWMLERQSIDQTTQVVGRITNIDTHDTELTLSPEENVDILVRYRLNQLGPE